MPEREREEIRWTYPAVLAGNVTLFENLLDLLLGILTSGNFLEGLGGDNTLERFKLEGVTGGEEVVVVDRLFFRGNVRVE